MKKICSIPVFLVILAFLSQGTVHSQSPATFDLEVDSSPFQTTPSDLRKHPAELLFRWGANQHIIDGFPDGTVKPDKLASEAEFLKMMFRGFGLAMPSASYNDDWMDGVYQMAKVYRYPAAGVIDPSARKSPITQGQAIQIIVAAQGLNFQESDAFAYALSRSWLPGQPTSLSQFDKDRKLTRTEALELLRHLTVNGMMKLEMRPVEFSSREALSAEDSSEVKSFPSFSLVNLPADGLTVKIGDDVLRLGDTRTKLEKTLGQTSESGIMNKQIYPLLTVHFNEENKMDYWSVDQWNVESTDESITTSLGIKLGVSNLFDVLEAYGTTGYAGQGIADYFYMLQDDGTFQAVQANYIYDHRNEWNKFYHLAFLIDRDTLMVTQMLAGWLPYSMY